MHVIAGKAICFQEALEASFVAYSQRVLDNMNALVEGLKSHDFYVIGSENHLCLVDVKKSVGLSGKRAEKVLDEVGITCNKNSIPFDTEKPMVTSGIRLGSAAMTTRGFGPAQFKQIAEWINQVLRQPDDEALKASVRASVTQLTQQFPTP